VRSEIIIARRSKQSDRRESSCGTRLRRRISPTRKHALPRTLRGKAVVDAVRATVNTMHASLEQMQVVEDMQRTLREIKDVNKL